MRPIRTEDDLVALRRAAEAYAVVAGWQKLGAFAKLADGAPRPLAELGGDPRALAITAPILVHLGLLVGDGERYALSPAARELARSGALPGAAALDTFGDLSRLDAVLARGGPARRDDGSSKATTGGVREADVAASRAFMQALYRRSEHSARATAEWLAPRMPAGGHLLDLGGGHGRYARELADRGFRATIFDKPLCVDLARELHGDALAYRAGDFERDDLGGPYDAVLASNIVHGCSPDENRALVARLAAALRPGGFLVVKDMLIDDAGEGPENAALFGLTMLLYTDGGRSYRFDELAGFCRAAGLAMDGRATFESFALVFAKKPA